MKPNAPPAVRTGNISTSQHSVASASPVGMVAGKGSTSTAPAVVPQAGAKGVVGLVAVSDPAYALGSRVLSVGADKQVKTIAAAINSSLNGKPDASPALQAGNLNAPQHSIASASPVGMVAGKGSTSTAPAVVPQAGAKGVVGLVAVSDPVYAAGSRVLSVGADKQFKTIAAAINSSLNGDVILVDAGTYKNDFAVVNTKLTILAVGGRVNMVATVPPPNWKGILTVETDLRIEGFSFSGAHIPDQYGHNGAGIRQEGGKLVLFNDEFRNNQNGILTSAVSGQPVNSINIDHCLFDSNGGADGNSVGNIHNIYIGATDSATVSNSVFQNALVGHEFKSRAVVNTLTNNLFVSGVGTGTGSYDIDIPNGGQTVLTGNTIVKGPNAENSNMVHFGGEGIPYAQSSLTIQSNLFLNSNPQAVGLLNQTSVTAQLSGNVLDGLAADAFIKGPANATGNFDNKGAKLADATLVGILPGSTMIFTDTAAHSILLEDGKTQAVQGGNGRLTVGVNIGHVIVIGGRGGLDLTENASTGGNQYTTAAGVSNSLRMLGMGQNTIDSEGTDLIIAGDGNQSAQINGNATITGGKGNCSWNVNGTASINTGSGSAAMSLGAAGKLTLTGTNSFYSLAANGGVATFDTVNGGKRVAGSIRGGALQMQVYEGSMHITTAAGSVGAVIRLDQGDANVSSAGSDVIYAGTGNSTIILSGKAQVYAGTGKLSVFGRGDVGGADVYGAGGRYLISGDGGNITYHGGDRDSTVTAELSNIRLLGAAGRLSINGGSRETIVGGFGGIVFHELGGGANTITTLAGSANQLDLTGSDQVDSFGRDVITTSGSNQAMTVHGDTTLSLGKGNSQVALYGKDIVRAYQGFNRFTVGKGADVSFDLGDTTQIHETNAAVRVTFSNVSTKGSVPASMSVAGGAADIYTTPQGEFTVITDGVSGPVAIVAGTGTATVHTSGTDSIHLGSGASTLTVHGSGSEVWAGSGSLVLHGYDWAGGQFTLHGGSGAIAVDQGPSTMRFIGGSGAATLAGGQLDIVAGSGSIAVSAAQVRSFLGGVGSADLALNDQGSKIMFGSGQTTVHEIGWGKANIFGFAAGQGGVVNIEGFRQGVDKIILDKGISVTSLDVKSGATHFLLTNGSDVMLKGILNANTLFG